MHHCQTKNERIFWRRGTAPPTLGKGITPPKTSPPQHLDSRVPLHLRLEHRPCGQKMDQAYSTAPGTHTASLKVLYSKNEVHITTIEKNSKISDMHTHILHKDFNNNQDLEQNDLLESTGDKQQQKMSNVNCKTDRQNVSLT